MTLEGEPVPLNQYHPKWRRGLQAATTADKKVLLTDGLNSAGCRHAVPLRPTAVRQRHLAANHTRGHP